MSKQSDAKEAQGYIAKPIPSVCSNCAHFKSDIVAEHCGWGGPKNVWIKEKNLRCSIGDFAVKKMATCNLFERKEI